ncbi:isoprenoid synthase domain-containing protein [Infundibulicybe gibba]|nr:isoprenoid synthase domain-containing protein [Infundibulicybe gibba]
MSYIITTPQIHSQIPIPDLLRNWPWPRRINPITLSVKWNRLLAGCRVGCDLMNLFLLIDEYSDITDPSGVRQQADIIMDALHHPHTARPAGEWVGGEAARQFWENAIKTATPAFQQQFKDAFKLYTDGVVQEAEDRARNYIRDIESYLDLRRNTSGVQATGGGGHNLVTAVMHERGCTLEEAIAWISRLNDDLIEVFLEEYERVSYYAGERYFGKEGLEVKRTGVVRILPRRQPSITA